MLKIIVFSYLAVAGGLYAFQRSLLYHPSQDMANPEAYGLTMQTVTLTTADALTLTAWYAPPARKTMPTILFAQGNALHLGNRAEKFKSLLAQGFGLLAVSYRGYGPSEGSPSEEGLYEDIETALRYLEKAGVSSNQVVMYGESLGTGVAVEMATRHTFRAVVLEAPYTSVTRRAMELYPLAPVDLLLKDRFDSLSKINRVTVPLLILHITGDTIVPVEHGKELYTAANKPKKLVLFEGNGHVDIDAGKRTAAIAAFLAATPNSSNP